MRLEGIVSRVAVVEVYPHEAVARPLDLGYFEDSSGFMFSAGKNLLLQRQLAPQRGQHVSKRRPSSGPVDHVIVHFEIDAAARFSRQ